MASSIAEYGNMTNNSAPLDLDNYPVTREFRLPTAGIYTVQAPSEFDDTKFGASASGNTTAQIDPTIIGGEHDGFALKYQRVSAATFGEPPVSILGKYLKAAGLTGKIGGDEDSLKAAVRSTAGRQYRVRLDWEAYNGNTGLNVKGMTNFPKNGTGYQQWVEDPNDVDPETGKAKRVPARLRIKTFLPLQTV